MSQAAQNVLDLGTLLFIRPTYRPRVAIEFETPHFKVRTSNSPEDFEKIVRLRYAIFCKEMAGQKATSGFDVDEFDADCDHLLVVDKKTDQAVGTYRLRSSRFTRKFYSETEFDLSDFLKTPEHKLELGRACIRQDFRAGMVIQLLFRGIAEYLHETDSRFLFGCSSLATDEFLDVKNISSFLEEQEAIETRYSISPLPKYLEYPRDKNRYTLRRDDRKPLPPLIHTYLRMGAKLTVPPAYDAAFKCYDFLTILERDQLSAAIARRYQTPKR